MHYSEITDNKEFEYYRRMAEVSSNCQARRMYIHFVKKMAAYIKDRSIREATAIMLYRSGVNCSIQNNRICVH